MQEQLFYLMGLPVGATVGIIGTHIGYHMCCARDARAAAYAGVVLFTILTGLLYSACATTLDIESVAGTFPISAAAFTKACSIGLYVTGALDFLCLAILHGIQSRGADLSPRNLQREINRRGMGRGQKPDKG